MFKRMHMPVRTILLPIILGLLWTLLCASNAIAQKLTYAQSGQPEDPGLELLQEEPHDLMFFTEEAGGGCCMT